MLAGRAAELRELCGAAGRAVAQGRGWVGLIGGESGIGKTWLAAACATQLAEDGFNCAWVSCPEDAGAPPFWAWAKLLEQLGAGDALRAGADEADPELARFLMFDAVAVAVQKATANGPLLLVMDDLHWADPGSRRLLAAARGAMRTVPVVALGTYRDTEPGGEALPGEIGPERQIVLNGLSPVELAAAVRTATGSAVPEALLAGLHARTGGNPYFAAEVVRLLRAEGRLDISIELPAGELSEPLPRTVRAALERRLARLPDLATSLMRVAALLGDPLDLRLLAEVVEEPQAAVAAALAAARAVKLVSGDRFAHPLVREVLDAQLGPVDRLRWHAQAGAVLARRCRAGIGDPAAAARHLLAAAELGGQAGPAVELAWLAAADAVRRGGYEDAARLLSAALVVAGSGIDRGGLLCALAEAALAAGEPGRARAAYAEAAELARRTDRPELLAGAALGLAGGRGGFEIDLRDPDRVAVLTEALEALPPSDSPARAAVLGRLSLALAYSGPGPGQREALSAEAVTMARRLGEPAGLAAALAARCDAVSSPDHVAERRVAAGEIVTLARAGGDRPGELLGRRLLVVALAEAGDWASVDVEIESYARLVEQLAQPRMAWYAPLWRGARALMRGDLGLAEEHARELADLAERAGSVNARLLGLVQRYVRLIGAGRADDLDGEFAEIVALTPDDPLVGACAHAFLCAHRGQLAEARAHLDLVVAGELPGDAEWLPRYVQVSLAAVVADHRTAAETAYRLLRPYAGQAAIEGILAGSWGSVDAHLGLLGRYLGHVEEADAHFARALELDAAAGAALAARTREWAGDGATVSHLHSPALFCLDGEIWTLRYAGRTVRLRNSKGLRDLAVLLARPGQQTHVGELTGAAGLPGSDAGPMADRRALGAYRERLRVIDAELDTLDAGAVGAEALNRDREALLAELSASTGLGGRARAAGSPGERMRKAVTYRIRHAITRVADAHPELGRHLAASVRTGTWCGYAPEHRVDWQI